MRGLKALIEDNPVGLELRSGTDGGQDGGGLGRESLALLDSAQGNVGPERTTLRRETDPQATALQPILKQLHSLGVPPEFQAHHPGALEIGKDPGPGQ